MHRLVNDYIRLPKEAKVLDIGCGSAEYVKKHLLTVTAKAGSAIVFDSMLMHRAGYNHSNKIRRSLNHMYTKPFIKQKYDFPTFIDESLLTD